MSNELTIAGRQYDSDSLQALCSELISGSDWEKDIGSFITQWLNEKETIVAQTSGSTGSPKHIEISKSAMRQSALLTAEALGLSTDDRALLCIPARYIGGMMMIVRAFVVGLDLHWIRPSSCPDFNALHQRMAFTAMTPMQAQLILAKDEGEFEKAGLTILGGAPIPNGLKTALTNVNQAVFHTFGMTETVSHIALKRLDGVYAQQEFTALKGVQFSTNEEDCLVIEAEHLDDKKIVTNDVVHLISDQQFIWKGRADNVINSGGMKLHPEMIESELALVLESDFFVIGEEDELLGERLVLCLENIGPIRPVLLTIEGALLRKVRPKKIYQTERFLRTENGKIKRLATLTMIKSNTLDN